MTHSQASAGGDQVQAVTAQTSEISTRTIAHYNVRAAGYWAGTREHDVSQNVAALLAAIELPPPWTILDLGCGPGRDLLTFKRLGHHVIGLDGAPEFVAMARANAGCEVWHQDFLALDLPRARFDGIFANAALFHLPSLALPEVLARLSATLKPSGVLFTSNPRGNDQEGWHGERYGTYYSWERWRDLLTAAGFGEIQHYYRPSGLPRAEQPWLASVWRKFQRVAAVAQGA
jgi:SAM-dependent methyltransferase